MNAWILLQRSLKAARRSIALLLGPITTPFEKLFRKLGFKRRSIAWKTPAMERTQAQLMRSMFQPLAEHTQNMGPQMILRPVNVFFVFFSLFAAFLINVLPWGSLAWVPDFLALTLTFWAVREPRIVSLGVAFTLGILMDVHDATVLGEHALSYSLLAYASAVLSRRLPSFSLPLQALQLWPIFTLTLLVTYGIRSFFGGLFPGWGAVLIAPAISALLWPALTWLLLAPQRRPIEVDETRPL